MSFQKKYPWLPLALVNVVLVLTTVLLFILWVSVGLSESYHPNAFSRPLSPTLGVPFLISVSALLLSVSAWFWWRNISSKISAVLLAVYLGILVVGGGISYLFTSPNFATYTFLYHGNTYEIPRQYNPTVYLDDGLKIEVCDENPTEPRYTDNPFFDSRDFPCTPVSIIISPTNTVLGEFDFMRTIADGALGFTVSTSSDGLILADYDDTLLGDNQLERLVFGLTDMETVIQSIPYDSMSDVARRNEVLYLESENSVLQWITACTNTVCASYQPVSDSSQFVIRTEAINDTYKETQTVARVTETYKERSANALTLFESFIVGGAVDMTESN